ncbi:MAG TPA: hypothetical protein VN843_06755, partial [Anaerolineales bacterium]|nr:hypothetical protein [Anaerolineales bacterium]
HHHPGDFGYGRGPEQFWEASSIGQVCDFLGLKPTEEFLLVAASDHCPAHAYKGKCPGVDPDALMKHRLLIKSAFQKRSLEEIMADVTSTMSLIQKKLDAGDAVPHFPLEEKAAELPEASLRVGVPITYELEGNERYPRVKVGMLNGTPELLREWMIVTAPAMGLVDIYGDPERGYAGGYIPSV